VKLITFQGISTAGKTTLAKAVAKTVNGNYYNPYNAPLWKTLYNKIGRHVDMTIINGVALSSIYHNELQQNMKADIWTVLDENLVYATDATYDYLIKALGMKDLKKGYHFAIMIPETEYIRRKQQRDGAELSKIKYDADFFIETIKQQRAIPLDGTDPIDVNIKHVLNHIKGN